MVRFTFGSHTTTSASDPGAILPFFGYRLKIWAALVEVTSTNLHSSMMPSLTPLVYTIDMRSSTPLTPLGILVKSSFPSALCSVLKVQLSLPTQSRDPLETKKTTSLPSISSNTDTTAQLLRLNHRLFLIICSLCPHRSKSLFQLSIRIIYIRN